MTVVASAWYSCVGGGLRDERDDGCDGRKAMDFTIATVRCYKIYGNG